MRYCYTEAGKAEITLELTIADLQELRTIVRDAAAADGSTYRTRRLSDDLAAAHKSAAESIRSFAAHLLRDVGGDQ
mgnify:CR=1 FL=1|jgi:hypothetical protein